MIAAPELLENARGKALIGDAGYDSNAFLQAVRDKGMKPEFGWRTRAAFVAVRITSFRPHDMQPSAP